ncbi:MAG: hypothetical protein HC877_23635 [Thioploca sp.]|nr:hypothetical protein [Thioploca sp.]
MLGTEVESGKSNEYPSTTISEFCIILPVIPSKIAIALSVAPLGPTTSPEPDPPDAAIVTSTSPFPASSAIVNVMFVPSIRLILALVPTSTPEFFLTVIF